MSESREMIVGSGEQLLLPTTRRRFLGLLGVAGTIVLLPGIFSACSDGGITDPATDPANYSLDLRTDAGILNYLYALEQVEAAFYSAALSSAGYQQLSASEQEVLSDIQKHEVIHRELLRSILGSGAIPKIAFDAGTLTTMTATRAALLQNARLLEDTGVAAYDAAGKYLTDTANLVALGKIVPVEGRHSAAIRDLGDSSGILFAGNDVVTAGLDVASEPQTVVNSVVALGALVSPLSIGSGPSTSLAAPAVLPTAAQNAIDFVLALAILENEMYKGVLGTSGSSAQNTAFATVAAVVQSPANGTLRASLQQIQTQEAAHVAALGALGAKNVFGLTADSFDFTGGGSFSRATTTLGFLLELMQGFEDLGVRAYAGRLVDLMPAAPVLQTVLRMHSVEARHAARIRRIRRGLNPTVTALRLSGAVRGGDEAAAGLTDLGDTTVQAAVKKHFAGIYGKGGNATTAPAESNTVQNGVDVSGFTGLSLTAEAAQEAFDEPLGRADVVAILQPFVRVTIS